jgi:hypothetical protein
MRVDQLTTIKINEFDEGIDRVEGFESIQVTQN